MMHFHNFDVPFGPEPRRDLFDQAEQQIDAEAGIGGPHHRHPLGGAADRRLLVARQPGRADHDRPAELGGERRMRRGRLRRREIDRDIAVAQHLARIRRGGEADPADSGQFAEILAEAGAPRPGDAAAQAAALARDDVGDQHAAHPAATPDHSDSGLGHDAPPSPAITALPPRGKNTSGAVCGNAGSARPFPRLRFSSTPAP